MKGIIVIDVEKCLACRSCELQCALEHSKSKELFQAIFEDPLPQPRIRVEGTTGVSLPLQCRHCEDPPCVRICPTKAIEKMGLGELVLIKEELCIGCKWCILVCPFGVIDMGRTGKAVIKCDLCVERLNRDEKPACVQGCPTGAITYRSIAEVIGKVRKETVSRFMVAFKKGEQIIEG